MSWKSRRKKKRKNCKIVEEKTTPAPLEIMMTCHHRRCKINGGSDSFPPHNVALVPLKKHQAWHTLTGSMSPYQIAKMFTELYIDPEYTLVAVKKK
jgi:hypothetical protein